MTDTLMVDLSSNNGTPDLHAHYAAGFRTIALKATEGTGYTWPAMAGLADQWHRLGGRVVFYHFARPGDPLAQADRFLSVVAPHARRGDVLALDAEVSGVTPDFQARFLHRLDVKGPRFGPLRRALATLTYGPASFLAPFPANGSGLWVADYSPPADRVPGWRSPVAWQFTDSASGLPGIPGAVDCSHLYRWMVPVLRRPVVRYPQLVFGARGPWVVKLQDLLNRHGARLHVDGVFGPATKAAVNLLKRGQGWKADGVAGGRVWRVLAK